MDNVPWRDRYLHERADLRRTAITRDDLVAHSWRLRFREPDGGVQVREVPPRACASFLTARASWRASRRWSGAWRRTAARSSSRTFRPTACSGARTTTTAGRWRTTESVHPGSVEARNGARTGAPGRRRATAGNRHAREASVARAMGGALVRTGRPPARIAFEGRARRARGGGALASLPMCATGYVSEEESDLSFERYQTDPGAILVELQEGYQLETLWHERNNRLYALISLARAALETGKARQALDAARRASVNVLHQGDLVARRRRARARAVEELRARALSWRCPRSRSRAPGDSAAGAARRRDFGELEASVTAPFARIFYHHGGRSRGCVQFLSRGFKLDRGLCPAGMYSDVGKGEVSTGGSAVARR